MTNDKLDLRIKKTQRALTTALDTLLRKQSFASITVNDLCKEALVSRSAFYANFEDKYALLRFAAQQLHSQLFDAADDLDWNARMRLVLRNVQDKTKIIKNLLLVDTDRTLASMMVRSFQQHFYALVERSDASQLPFTGPMDIIANYYCAGITSAILSWVRQNQPYTVEEMAECLVSLLPVPLRKA